MQPDYVMFTLKNSGGSATSALTITVTGSAFTISADSCTGTSLGPGKSCAVTVSYEPSSVGQSDSGTLTATSQKGAVSLTLLGTGGFGGCIVRRTGASLIPKC
jgi:hypothetical protein